MRWAIFVLILIVIALIVVLLFYTRKENNEKYCRMNEDCVPAQCCHPIDCVNIENKPNCKGIMCTMVCQGPMDCGQGHCACVNNECKAIIE